MGKKSFVAAVLAAIMLLSSFGTANASALTDISAYWVGTYAPYQPQLMAYGVMEDAGLLGRYKTDLLAKTEPDEYFVKIGESYPVGSPDIPPEAIPKKNQAYVWGLTKASNKLYFGTIANTLSLVLGGFLGATTPFQTNSVVHEFGESRLCKPPYNLPAVIGDWRPPRLHCYDLETNQIKDISPTSGLAAQLINRTIGIRSAGSQGNVVLFAGPNLGSTALNMFAYRADTGAFIGAISLTQYNDIRKWLEVNGVLYTTVGNTAGGGSVLRWRGSVENPFAFEEVGKLDSMGANITLHENRLFVTTWPSSNLSAGNLASLYMGPNILKGGLTAEHTDLWTKVWKADDYEPDAITAATYGGGDLFSHKGYLYWGTMHVPALSAVAAVRLHQAGKINLDANGNGKLDNDEIMTTFLGSYRPITIFRGKNFSTGAKSMDIVYGQKYLPVYDAAKKSYTIAYNKAHQNKMTKKRPLQGPSGMGNFFNAYTWTMVGYDGRLFIGTFDWSYVLFDMLSLLTDEQTVQQMFPAKLIPNTMTFGADLFRIDGKTGKAVPESVKGIGNQTSYGIRTMLADETSLYLGMANPMNIHPDGGWELIKLSK